MRATCGKIYVSFRKGFTPPSVLAENSLPTQPTAPPVMAPSDHRPSLLRSPPNVHSMQHCGRHM